MLNAFVNLRVRKDDDIEMRDNSRPTTSYQYAALKEGKEPRAKQLPNLLSKNETDEASMHIV